jgi:DNA-binding LytR/AlgR family response regulator
MTSQLYIPGHNQPVMLTEVVQLEGRSNYSILKLRNGRQIMSARTLGHYEETLPPGFVRIHKSCIVNLNYLQSIFMNHYLRLRDGQKLTIARRKTREVKAQIRAFMSSQNLMYREY